MKIKKYLLESDENVAEVNPDASVSEIAADIIDNVEAQTDGEKTVADADAKKAASEIKQTADDVGASEVAVVADDEYITENAVTEILDKAYNNAKKWLRRGDKYVTNVLITGLPGSGKTSIIETWVRRNMKQKGLILVPLNSTDPKIEAVVNGLPTVVAGSDEDKEAKLNYVYAKEKLAPLLNPANKGKCVLFVDEFNRQTDLQLRRAFMSLFNEKRNADGSLNFEETLLFTVVCINPNLGTADKGASKLNQAEMSRFLYHLTGQDSDPKSYDNYVKVKTANRLAKLGIKLPDVVTAGLKKRAANDKDPLDGLSPEEVEKYWREKDIKEIIKIADINDWLVSHGLEFDTEDDIKDIYSGGNNLFNSRILDSAIEAAGGDKDEFLDWVEKYSGLLQKDKDLLNDILADYNFDPKIYKSYGLDTGDGDEAETEAETATKSSDEDEEDELFANRGIGQSVGQKTTKSEIEDIVSGW